MKIGGVRLKVQGKHFYDLLFITCKYRTNNSWVLQHAT